MPASVLMTPDQVHYGQANLPSHAARQLTLRSGVPRQPGALRQQAADTAGQNRPPPGSTPPTPKSRACRCQPRPPEIVETGLVQPPFGLVLCDRSPHQTSDKRVSWTGFEALSSGTSTPLGTTHGDGAAFNRPGSARSARNTSPPHYDTDPKPAVPSLNDEPGCIKVVDTFRFASLPGTSILTTTPSRHSGVAF